MSSAPWLDVALSYKGTREWPGERHNPRIVKWLKRYAGNIREAWIRRKGDQIPWCAVFVSACLEEAGYPSTRHALAASYLTYGKPSNFKRGAILVLRRKGGGPDEATGSRGGNHVTFLLRVTKKWYVCIGGNQRNQVKVSYYPRSKYEVRACRAPLQPQCT